MYTTEVQSDVKLWQIYKLGLIGFTAAFFKISWHIHGDIFILNGITFVISSTIACVVSTASIAVFLVGIPYSEWSQAARTVDEKIGIVSVNIAYVWDKRSIVRGIKGAHRAGEDHGSTHSRIPNLQKFRICARAVLSGRHQLAYKCSDSRSSCKCSWFVSKLDDLCEGPIKSVRRDYLVFTMNKKPKEMTTDELLVKLKEDSVNTNAATTAGGESGNRMSYIKSLI